ncbi:MAG: hypothetical protein IPM56_11170 [Ignavibacteriales bacterium]|nr:MAG: hypothetical protein IPM56_11170 [Ignavibacteriales bacterium]
MKKFVILFAILFCGRTILLAQDYEPFKPSIKMKFYSGLSLPMGNFGSGSGNSAGYANTGFFGSVEGLKSLNENLNLMLSLAVSINQLDVETLDKRTWNFTASTESYYSTWLLAGLQGGPERESNFEIFFSASIGLLYVSFPELIVNNIKHTSENTVAFAFGIGSGVEFERLNFGIRYLHGFPEYSGTGNILYPGTSAASSLGILLLMLGVSFG